MITEQNAFWVKFIIYTTHNIYTCPIHNSQIAKIKKKYSIVT